MSDFNPRAYMNSQSRSDNSDAGFQLDGLTVSALLVIGLAGGLFGYNTLMDFRQKNKAKLNQMMVEAEAIDEAREDDNTISIGGISLMANYANNMNPGGKSANNMFSQLHEATNQSKNKKDMNLPIGSIADAKQFLAYPKTNAGEYAKYQATRGMILSCRYDGEAHTRFQNYKHQNEDKIDRIKALYKERALTSPETIKQAPLDELRDAKSMIDVMKWRASGGMDRHMASIGGLAAADGTLYGDVRALTRSKGSSRRHVEWSSDACNYLNQQLSNGKLNVRVQKT